LVKGNGWLVGG